MNWIPLSCEFNNIAELCLLFLNWTATNWHWREKQGVKGVTPMKVWQVSLTTERRSGSWYLVHNTMPSLLNYHLLYIHVASREGKTAKNIDLNQRNVWNACEKVKDTILSLSHRYFKMSLNFNTFLLMWCKSAEIHFN